MLFICFRKHSNIIQVNYNEPIFLINKCNVNFSLKYSSCIHKTKGNFYIHKSPRRCGKSYFVLIITMNQNLFVSWETIQQRNSTWTNCFLQDVIHFRQRVVVLERETLFRFLKSTQSLISPVIFLIGTSLENHFENLRGTMIFESKSFLTSFCIKGKRLDWLFSISIWSVFYLPWWE